MRKRTMLMCALIMLLLLTGVASASPEQPKDFRIKGTTTLIDFKGLPLSVFLKSEGRVIQDIQGTFTMNEWVLFGPFSNIGTLTITTKKGDRLSIAFEGFVDMVMENVWGTFGVTSGTGVYEGFTGSGSFDGTADHCDLPCDPFSDPKCVRIKEPDCDGFYVDFTFDS